MVSGWWGRITFIYLTHFELLNLNKWSYDYNLKYHPSDFFFKSLLITILNKYKFIECVFYNVIFSNISIKSRLNQYRYRSIAVIETFSEPLVSRQMHSWYVNSKADSQFTRNRLNPIAVRMYLYVFDRTFRARCTH